MGFPDHMEVLVLIFWKAALLFSIVAALLLMPTNSVTENTTLQSIIIFKVWL